MKLLDRPETRIAGIEAREAIRRLISAYCDAVARRDADAAGALFAPDARLRIADFPELAGREAITQGMRQTFAQAGVIQQRCDTGLIDLDGNSATARLGVLEAVRRPGEDAIGLIFGFYEDRYALIKGEGWRFAARRYTMQARVLVPASKVQVAAPFLPELMFDC